jgi:hypothetical protein
MIEIIIIILVAIVLGSLAGGATAFGIGLLWALITGRRDARNDNARDFLRQLQGKCRHGHKNVIGDVPIAHRCLGNNEMWTSKLQLGRTDD